MTRARYMVDQVTPTEVFILDCDGPMSITNDAEAVVAEVSAKYKNRRIVYRDTMGQWDELLHNDGVFTDFAPYRE